MVCPEIWQKAWDNAQPELKSIQRSLTAISPSQARVVRVAQLDAELLDQELVQLLQEPLNKTIGMVHTSFRTRFEPELTFLIRMTLYKLSMWDTGTTYGAKLQDLKYRAPNTGPSLAPSGLPTRTLAIHAALTLLLPYVHTRLRAHGLSHAWPDAPSSDRRRRMWEVLTRLESLHAFLALLTFIRFLWDGRYRTVADRLLNMRLVSTRTLVNRNVSYEFMNRQMVWHAFTEFLLFLLPLVNMRAVRRRLREFISQIARTSLLPTSISSAIGVCESTSSRKTAPPRGKYWSLSEDQCAICAENSSFSLDVSDPRTLFSSAFSSTLISVPSTSTAESTDGDATVPPVHPIHTPYITSCDHIYCYYCLLERMIRAADEGEIGWECLRCAQSVRNGDRWQGQIPEDEVEVSEFDDAFLSSSNVSLGSDYIYPQ